MLKDKHSEIMRVFSDVITASHQERLIAHNDRRFYSIAGAQWEGSMSQLFNNLPQFESNKIHLAILRIISENRNNKQHVLFKARDNTDNQLAEACAETFRYDEDESCADEAYDNALEEGVGGGFGAWRLTSNYEDEYGDTQEQRIKILPIFDADVSVYFDLNAKRYDKSDAKRCWVVSSYGTDDFKENWPRASPVDTPQAFNTTAYDWYTPETIRVAEYYEVEEKKVRLNIYRAYDNEDVKRYFDDDVDEDIELMLTSSGYFLAEQRKVMRKKVHKYIVSGAEILEDCGYIPGPNIPVVPYYGKRWYIGNQERFMGHVRLSRDIQQLLNMGWSKVGETVAASSLEKPIFAPEQIAGLQTQWAEHEIKRTPYVLINPMTDPSSGQSIAVGPLGYTKSPEISQSLASLVSGANTDLKELLGDQQQGDKIVSNISEKTINHIQRHLDMQTYIYISNFARSLLRSAKIWLGMAQEIYFEQGRKLFGKNEGGGVIFNIIGKLTVGPDGTVVKSNDFSQVSKLIATDIDTGPSSSTKRQSLVSNLTNMLSFTQTDAETTNILLSLILMNLEGDGLDDINKFYRNKLLRLGVITPNQEEASQLAKERENVQPDAQSLYLHAAAAKADAETRLTEVKTQLTSAQTLKTIKESQSL